MFADIGLLVLEGDAAGLAARVSELSAALLAAQSDGAGRRAASVDGRRDGRFSPRREEVANAPAALLHSPDS